MKKSVIGYFVDSKGSIGTIFDDEHDVTTDLNADIKIHNGKVQVIFDQGGGSYQILDEHVFWSSLIDLAVAIEKVSSSSADTVTLKEAIIEAHEQVSAFEKSYLEEHKKKPQEWPLTMERENAGVWFEQIFEFSNDTN